MKGKRAIVMGASSGIGMEVSKLLLADGWTIGIAARRSDLLLQLKEKSPDRVEVETIDVSLEASIETATVTTNALGFTRMVGVAYRYMANHGGGHIAAITSIAGTMGLGPAPSYSATKAFQNTYLQALEQQANTRKLKIRFTDIRPGFVDTALLNDGKNYPMLLNKEDVAHEIMEAINKKSHVRVIDWRYRILTALWRCIPRCIWRHLPLSVKDKKKDA